jgi:hypothetical protein
LHLARAITRDFWVKIRSSYLSGSPKRRQAASCARWG